MLGVEGYRYYFMRDVKPGEDGAISFNRMEQVYNADLANSWGNLVSRALNMSAKYFDGKTPVLPAGWAERESPLTEAASGLYERYAQHMDVFEYPEAIDEVMALVGAANHYIEDAKPWALAKDPAQAEELAFVIGGLLEAIRISAHLLAPFTPETCDEVLRRLSLEGEIGADDLAAACAWGQIPGDLPVTKGDALFPRLQKKD